MSTTNVEPTPKQFQEQARHAYISRAVEIDRALQNAVSALGVREGASIATGPYADVGALLDAVEGALSAHRAK